MVLQLLWYLQRLMSGTMLICWMTEDSTKLCGRCQQKIYSSLLNFILSASTGTVVI